MEGEPGIHRLWPDLDDPDELEHAAENRAQWAVYRANLFADFEESTREHRRPISWPRLPRVTSGTWAKVLGRLTP